MTHKRYSPLYSFLSLAGERLRNAQLSDHEMVITQDVLSWNIMMQGRYNAEKKRYNNGFALIENKSQYHARLKKIVAILAEINTLNPYLRVLTLQEAPVEQEDIDVFTAECLNYPSLNKFTASIQDNNLYGSWGVLTWVDTKQYEYQIIPIDFTGTKTLGLNEKSLQVANQYLSIENRIQVLCLMSRKIKHPRYVYNVHLPYDITKTHPEKMMPLLNSILPNKQGECVPYITLSGDFNCSITAHLNLKYPARYFMPENNSTEFHETPEQRNSLETVDAIVTLGAMNARDHKVKNLNDTSLFRLLGGYVNEKLNKQAIRNTLIEYFNFRVLRPQF